MLDHHLHLLADVVGVQAHPAHQALEGFAALDLLVVPLLAVVGQLEGQLVRGVVLQHVKDEAFFDGLAHRIDVEGRWEVVRACGLLSVGAAPKELQGLGLGRGSEGHVGDGRAAACLAGTCGHLGGQNVLGRDLPAVCQILDLLRAEHLL